MLRDAVSTTALSHPDDHGCDVCRAARGDEDAYNRILHAYAGRMLGLPGSPPVTAGDLEAHARKYGADGVGEVADAHGIEVDVTGAPAPRRGRRR